MCLACEEAEMHYRWRLVEQIAKGEMPDGLTAEDLANGPAAAGRDRDHARTRRQSIAAARQRRVAADPPPRAFVCDSPDGE